MFTPTFHTILARERASRGLSFRQLEQLTRIGRTRLWRLERGAESPTKPERETLNQMLSSNLTGLLFSSARPSRFYQRLRARGNRYTSCSQPYFPPCDRKSRIRLLAVSHSYGALCQALLHKIAKRRDCQDLNYFCEHLSLGSALECLFLMAHIAEGATPGFVIPERLHPRLPHRVTCPEKREEVGYRPVPCLLSEGGALFPQMSVLTPRLYTVDFLRHTQGKWDVIGVDGRGHNPRGDSKRAFALGLEVERWSEARVLRFAQDISQ